ncbi:oxygenase MpaB family protein [Candidatus Blastococcus massiliensis]|uniref:oxygenase MpaB family protein n=1 Tax=Candidatus Blastococcus massiliensis TaxID=1470358 RepID=UPI0004B44F07|nr:oxygenase MpaB family protein [Candidatus Blastococcus massiliensis]
MSRLPSRTDWTAEEDRLGFFGPDSVTWRVHADPSFSVGGLRALLLQALHPVAMDGVARFSVGFTEAPWPRLIRTAAYVDTLTFGTRTEAVRAVARVRGIHRRLGGTEETTGRTYRVDDPDLLLWVHCCEVDSLLSVARRAGVPLTDDDADRYVAEQVTAAGLVGIDPADVPDSVAALAAYFERMRPSLALTPAARDAYRLVVLPPMPTWVRFLTPAQPAWGGLASLAVALLPVWARRMYSLPGLALTDVAATPALKAFRQTVLRLPLRAQRSPIVWAGFERVGAQRLSA